MKKRKLNVKLPFRRELGEEGRLFVHVVIRTDMDGVATCYRKLRGRACRKLIVEHSIYLTTVLKLASDVMF